MRRKRWQTGILLFLVGGVLGSLLDTAYQSIHAGTFSYSSFLGTLFSVFVPFLPVYGFGLVTIYLLYPFAKPLHPLQRAVLYAASLTGLEFLAGLSTEFLFGLRLWDYSASRFDVYGYVDALHTLYWTVLGMVVHWGMERVDTKKQGT